MPCIGNFAVRIDGGILPRGTDASWFFLLCTLPNVLQTLKSKALKQILQPSLLTLLTRFRSLDTKVFNPVQYNQTYTAR